MVDRCSGEGYGHTGIVELTVREHNPTLEAGGAYIGDQPLGLLTTQQSRGSESQLSRHQVIDFESCTIEWTFPPIVGRNHKTAFAHQVWGIAAHDAALLEGLQYQANVAILQVTNATVD